MAVACLVSCAQLALTLPAHLTMLPARLPHPPARLQLRRPRLPPTDGYVSSDELDVARREASMAQALIAEREAEAQREAAAAAALAAELEEARREASTTIESLEARLAEARQEAAAARQSLAEQLKAARSAATAEASVLQERLAAAEAAREAAKRAEAELAAELEAARHSATLEVRAPVQVAGAGSVTDPPLSWPSCHTFESFRPGVSTAWSPFVLHEWASKAVRFSWTPHLPPACSSSLCDCRLWRSKSG